MLAKWGAALFFIAACATKAPPVAAQMNLEQQAQATLTQMEARQPGLHQLIGDAAGYAVFPDVGAGGAVVAGGAFGRGILFERGQPTGYVELKQGSIGLELGGQTYAELLVLKDRFDIDRLKAGEFRFGADAAAVILKSGAAAQTAFASGASVFVMPRGGLMVGVSIAGQKIEYQPLG